jgi:hypothetical protein
MSSIEIDTAETSPLHLRIGRIIYPLGFLILCLTEIKT